MKVIGSEIFLASSRSYFEKNVEEQSLTIWKDPETKKNQTEQKSDNVLNNNSGINLKISHRGKNALINSNALQHASPNSAVSDKNNIVAAADNPEEMIISDKKISIMKAIVESITGKKIHISNYSRTNNSEDISQKTEENPKTTETEEGWGFIFKSNKTHFEQETTVFKANGIINTEDGRQIDFSLFLAMDRQYFSEENIEINAGDAVKIDPLVINFDGFAQDLDSMKFSFDLDADGKEDEISYLNEGSAFLSYDKNSDGKINDGTELFGPQSGDGFADLSKYDEDNNNWIDENDSIFNELSLWFKNKNGDDKLINLKDAGVGAIYLSNVSTKFDLTNPDNTLNGMVNKSGLYLKENGSAGVVQQIDLVS